MTQDMITGKTNRVKRTGDLKIMNLYDFCKLLHEDYILVAINRGEVVFDGRVSSIGVADTLGVSEAQRFIIRDIELDSEYYDADIVVSGQMY